MKNFYKRSMLIIMFLLAMALLVMLAMGQAKAATPSSSTLLFYQQDISGTVTNTNGEPLLGVTVIVKNKQYGTTTNSSGIFNINANNKDTLVFSFIGFKTKEMSINGRNSVEITLEDDIASLNEVEINAGYYTVTERERTGNISRVTASEIENQPVDNPLAALQGRMAGVEVQQPSGVSGLATSIQIRGRNSLRLEGNYPLFIVDGVPVNSSPISSIGPFSSNTGIDPLNTLNLSNIESIEVLKDADATAIYGSRGANGVVLITTKTGNKYGEQTGLEARFYSGVSNVSNKMKLMNTSQYLSVRREAFENDGMEPTDFNAPDLTVWDQNRFTDWQDVLMGETATINNLNLSLSGGNENTTFLLGGSYQVRGDVFPGDFGYKKLTSNFNLRHTSRDEKFNLNFSANYGIDDNQLFFGTNFVQMALTLPPNAPKLYNEDGSLNWADGSWSNPLSGLYRPQDIETNNLLANLSLSYKILNGLAAKVSLGYSNLESTEVTRNLINSYNPDTWDRINLISYHSFLNRKSWIVEPQISYSRSFEKLNITSLLGATLQENVNNQLATVGTGYRDDSVAGNLEAADEVRIDNDRNINYKYAALFGRVGLNWAEKYFLNFTGRRDGSSRFGSNKRFAEFWAIGSAWIFSEESFFKKNLSFISFGKLRGSYGTSGSDQIPDYGYLDSYETTAGPGGLYPTRIFNPDFSWEINKKLEVGLQLGLFKNRVNLETSWYRNRSSNQLIGYPLPATTGFSSVLANLPATIENTGLELSLSTTNFQSQNFSWRTSLNFTVPKNKLVEFDDLELTSYRNTYRIGEPLDISLLYQYDGINPDTGQYQVADANGDGRLDFNDRVVEARLGREYYGGLQNDFKIKNFSLSFLLEYVKQQRPSYLAELSLAPGRFGNNSIQLLNSWRQEGDNTNIQQLSQGIPSLLAYFNAVNSDLVIADASFLRMKTLTLNYQFTPGILENVGVRNCNLFVNAQNLFTISNYLGLDPQGGKIVPPLRTVTTGLQLNF